ncbi:MAG: hypothetical protein A4E66_02177 [Syntrophus sp. PtaB.Bin001]|nr:MAG: hypothetical protein A4E66_02177 [Syntrophus sp. PtaB.Bin001]
MFQGRQFAGKNLGNRFEASHAVFTLVGLFANALMGSADNFHNVPVNLFDLEYCAAVEIRGDLAQHEIGLDRRKKRDD